MRFYTLKELREFIKCPQFGDKEYGKWSALKLDVRYSIKRLLDIIDSADSIICVLRNKNKELKNKNKLLEEELKELKEGIEGVYNNMISLETINKYELNSDDIEVL